MSQPISIPVSKFDAGLPSYSPGSSFGSSSSRSVVTYSREELLALASSPLSQTPPDSPTFRAFPQILKSSKGGAALLSGARATPFSSAASSPIDPK